MIFFNNIQRSRFSAKQSRRTPSLLVFECVPPSNPRAGKLGKLISPP
jgi:hypothetical protein